MSRVTGNLHEDARPFKISHRVLLIKRIVSDKRYRENQNIQFMFNNFIFRNSAVYETMWENIVPS